MHLLDYYSLYIFADILYNSPTLKTLAAQSIINNDITTVEIPTHLQEEMNALKKLQQIQQDIKYCKRKYELLQEILNQIDEDIFGNISEELIEEGIYYDIDELDESLEYYTECGKWFTIADHIVISMLNDKEDELEVIQNSLHPEYCNIIFIMSEIASDDLILENINQIIESLIDQEYRKSEIIIQGIMETENLSQSTREKEEYLNKLNELITVTRNRAMYVLDYKLYL